MEKYTILEKKEKTQKHNCKLQCKFLTCYVCHLQQGLYSK